MKRSGDERRGREEENRRGEMRIEVKRNRGEERRDPGTGRMSAMMFVLQR